MTKTSKKKGGKEKKHSKEENELTLNVYFKEGTEMKFLFLNGGRLVPHIVTSNRPSDTVSCRLVVKAKFLSGEALHPSRWISCGIGKEKMENSVVSWDTDPQQQGGLHGSITATWTGTLLFECGRLFTANKGKFSSLHFSLNIEPNVFPEAKIYCQNGISMIQLRQFKLVGVLPKGLSSKKFLSNVEQRMHHASPVGRMPVCTSTSTSTSTASTSSPSSSSSSSASHQRQSYFCQGGPQSNGSGLLKTSNSGALVHVKQEIDCDDNLDVGDVDMESSRTEFPNDDSVASSEEEESSDCGSDADSEEEDEDEDEDEERVLKRKFSAVEMASRMTAGNQLGSQVAYSADAGGKEEGEKCSGAPAEGYDTLLYDQRETVPLSLSYGGFSMADSSNILSIGDREDVNVSNYKRRKIVGASDVSSNDPFFITDGPTQTFPTFSFLNDDEDATSLDEMDMGGIEDDEHSPFAAGNASLAMENMNKTKEDTISQSSLHASELGSDACVSILAHNEGSASEQTSGFSSALFGSPLSKGAGGLQGGAVAWRGGGMMMSMQCSSMGGLNSLGGLGMMGMGVPSAMEKTSMEAHYRQVNCNFTAEKTGSLDNSGSGLSSGFGGFFH